MNLVIIDYGAGNIKSLQFAFKRLGVDALLTHDSEKILAADKVIFPGVGEAASAMQKLNSTGLNGLIPQLKQPVLGICLGMQLMCNYSEEGNTEGLKIFDTSVKHFDKEKVKVPQMGWNNIEELKTDLFKGVQEKEYMYLVHSYYAELNSDTIATTFYQLPFAAALNKDNFYGVQFHPEKSSTAGEKILKNFLNINQQ
ncbi:MAG: imidazole glycerol phosphate synthase subunit HisH [Flavobacteriaceae bacterium]|nr:imidazole glycerol phosphate synthase subunit HisH [Flavobacteriaceae bacterium]